MSKYLKVFRGGVVWVVGVELASYQLGYPRSESQSGTGKDPRTWVGDDHRIVDRVAVVLDSD